MKRKFKYIKVEDGTISVHETDSFLEVIKDTFNGYYNYDTTDYIFDENLNIRMFAKAESEFLDYKDTIYFECDGSIIGRLKGIILIAKNGKNNWHSLSTSDIKLILKKLEPHDNNTFIIRYPKYEHYDWLYELFEELDTNSH